MCCIGAERERSTSLTCPISGFLMIDGFGAPGGDAFRDALQALYSMSYGAHFALKKLVGIAPG
jgi:hypothetical protein